MNMPKDLHMCGMCKKVFNDLRTFIKHKTACYYPHGSGDHTEGSQEISLESGLFSNQTALDLTVLDNGPFSLDLEYDNEEVVSDNIVLQSQDDKSAQNQLNQILTSSKIVSTDINEEDIATLLVTQLSKEVINKSLIQTNHQTNVHKHLDIPEINRNLLQDALEPVEEVEITTLNNKEKNVCNICNFKTAHHRDLVRHMRKHTGELPYKCGVCDKKFARQDKLVAHKRIHSGDKRFKCQLCDYASTDSGALRKHLQIHTDERPHKCQICSYRARNASHMIVHLRTHTGDSPFFCQLESCGRTFKTSTDLRRHMKVHQFDSLSPTYSSCAGVKRKRRTSKMKRSLHALCVKAHECPYCDAAFVRQDSLRSHLKQHQRTTRSPEEPSEVLYNTDMNETQNSSESVRSLSPSLSDSAVSRGPVLLYLGNTDCLQDSLTTDSTVQYIMDTSFL